MTTKATFPYEIHPLANLGELQEKAILELLHDIKRDGYNPNEPLRLIKGKLADGRHRQEVCLRLGIVPPAVEINPRGGGALFVCNANSLRTYRTISTKDRIVYGCENFASSKLSVSEIKRAIGLDNNGQFAYALKAYKKSRRMKAQPNPWDTYKEGGTLKKLFEATGIDPGTGSSGHQLKEENLDLKDENDTLQTEKEYFESLVADRDDRIAELEKRVKSLDPQERVHRSALGEISAEDQLRDRLEFAEDEVKKVLKLNEKLAEQLKSQDRIGTRVADALTGLDWGTPVFPPPPLPSGSARPHEFLALMSDAHYGEFVNPEETLGVSYNREIAKARIEHYRDVILRFKELHSSAYSVKKLTLAVLGDMLSGMIHEELTATNEIPISQQSAEMAQILWDITKSFAGEFEEVELIIMPGNHPRLTKKPYHKEKWNNWEFAMGDSIHKAWSESQHSNIILTRPKDLVHVHEIFDQRIGMHHGDGIKTNSFAGIPFYGLKQQRDALQSMMSQLGLERIDMLTMGHFHQHVFWTGECDVLINGSIKGPDEYIMSTRLAATQAEQVLLEFHPKHGVVAQHHIKLGHIN